MDDVFRYQITEPAEPAEPAEKQPSTMSNIAAVVIMLCIIVLAIGGTVRALMWMFG